MLVVEQVAIFFFLIILVHHVNNKVTQSKFRWIGKTVSKHFKLVLNAYALARRVVQKVRVHS